MNAVKTDGYGVYPCREAFEMLEAWQTAGLNALRTEGGRLQRSNSRGLWRQTAGCNAGTTNACGQSAWWKLPRGILSILSVLGVLGVSRLANGRLKRPINRGLWRQTAGCNAGTANACGQRAWWKLPRGI